MLFGTRSFLYIFKISLKDIEKYGVILRGYIARVVLLRTFVSEALDDNTKGGAPLRRSSICQNVVSLKGSAPRNSRPLPLGECCSSIPFKYHLKTKQKKGVITMICARMHCTITLAPYILAFYHFSASHGLPAATLTSCAIFCVSLSVVV